MGALDLEIAPAELEQRLAFVRDAQALANRYHLAEPVEGLIKDLVRDLARLFRAEWASCHVLTEDPALLVVAAGGDASRPVGAGVGVNERSAAGYVALHRRSVNIANASDSKALASQFPGLQLRAGIDGCGADRVHQRLLAPVLGADGQMLGVLELANHRPGGAFPVGMERALVCLGALTATLLPPRRPPAPIPRGPYELLVMDGYLAAADLDSATQEARRDGTHIQELLSRRFDVPRAAIGQALGRFFGVPYLPFDRERIKPLDLLKNLKQDYVLENTWLPVEEGRDGILVLTMDPEQVRSTRVVANVFPKAMIRYCVTTAAEFQLTVERFFGAAEDTTSVNDLLSGLEDEDGGDEGPPPEEAYQDNELVKLVNRIINDAYKMGASDIHIEPRPGKEKTLIRFRRDGSLVPYIEVPAGYREAIVARIKIMCDLDISERRKPQDGKIKFKKFSPLDIELRVATIPSAGGVEDVVMRILAAGEPIPLDKLGVLPGNLKRLKEVVSKPYGIFFVCGPTGSGKTTTLHSILNYINTPDTKIWTAEDPVEITQKGLRQVQVNKKAGLDFAGVMRAFLRADPDVIMVGEMRDKETVSIGIEASLTGHLVFSTLHTNSAPESVIRLLDMGMDPFNFADAILGVLAQRLAKRLCPSCKQAYHPDAAEMDRFLREYFEELAHTETAKRDPDAARARVMEEWRASYGDEHGHFALYKAVGCEQCSGTGYRGRVGLHELMVGTDGVKRLIQERARVALLLAEALEDGMRTLKMDGMDKVLAGITDMKQVRAVCIK